MANRNMINASHGPFRATNTVFARQLGRVARSAELEFGVAVGRRAFGISQLTRHKHHNF